MTGDLQDIGGYQVLLSDDALAVYVSVPLGQKSAEVDGALDILKQFPRLGRLYDPLYDAARLPFDMYVLYAGIYGIYYEIDDRLKHVNVLFIEDQRRNPLNRFQDIGEIYG